MHFIAVLHFSRIHQFKERMKCAMCFNFRVVFIWMVLSGSNISGQSNTNEKIRSTSYPTCPILSNGKKSQYIEGYNLLPSPNSVLGCASLRSQKTSDGKYKENHVINLKNDRAATIYLTIRGIQRRTTYLLPHSKEYAFALYSNDDVTWLVSLENMPEYNVTYKFYRSDGSKVISTDSLQFSIVGDGNDGLSGPSLKNRLTSTKIFIGEELTSFTELSVSRYARATITTYLDQYNDSLPLVYTGNCLKLKENFHSPVVIFEPYKKNEPIEGCEADNSVQLLKNPDQVKAFVVDITVKNEAEVLIVGPTRKRIISLKIQEPYQRTDKTVEKIVIILRSDIALHWDVQVSHRNPKHKFDIVIEKNTESNLTLPAGANNFRLSDNEFHFENNNNETNLINIIETSIKGKVISCMKFGSLPDFVTITLNRPQPKSILPPLDPLTAVYSIYEKLHSYCANSTLHITVPRTVLEENQLSINFLKFGNGNCKYTTDSYGDDEIIAEKSCGMTMNRRSCRIELHFPMSLNVQPLPVECEDLDVIDFKHEVQSAVKTRCTKNTFVVTIPKVYLEKLDLTMLKNCRNSSTDKSVDFHLISDDGSPCALVRGKIKYELELHILPEDNNSPVSDDAITLMCINKDFYNKVSASYDIDIYEDFNLKCKLSSTESYLRITDKVYHAKVSISSEPSMSVYLSYCHLTSFRKKLVLVRNNCPVDPNVRFVSPHNMTKTNWQHFTFMPGRFFSVNDTGNIECEVSACLKKAADEETPYLPMCIHLHGFQCSDTSSQSNYALPPNAQEIINVGPFRLLPKHLKKESGHVSWIITLLLALSAFFFGCLLFFILWQIDKRTYKHPKSSRVNSKRCESNSSGESGSGGGSSHSTSSTKTTDASSGSFLCFSSNKENRASNSKETRVLMVPLLHQPQSVNSPVSHQSQLSKTNPQSSRNEILNVLHPQYDKPTKKSENALPNGHACHATANENTKNVGCQSVRSFINTAQQEENITTIQSNKNSKTKRCRDNQTEKPQTASSEATSPPHTSIYIKRNDDLTIAANTSYPLPLRSPQNGIVSGSEGSLWLCDPDVSLASRLQNLKE